MANSRNLETAMKNSLTKSASPLDDDIYNKARGRFLLEETAAPGKFRASQILKYRLAACDSGINYQSVMLAKVLYDLAGIDTREHVEAAVAAMGSERLDPQSLTEVDLENMKVPSQSELPALLGSIFNSTSEWISVVYAFGHAFGNEFKKALQTENKQRQQETKRLKKRLCDAVDYLFEALESGTGFTPHGNVLLVKIAEDQYRPLSSVALLAYFEAANALERIPSRKELQNKLAESYGDATYQKKKLDQPSEQIQAGPKISKLPSRTWTKILDQAGISFPKKLKKSKS